MLTVRARRRVNSCAINARLVAQQAWQKEDQNYATRARTTTPVLPLALSRLTLRWVR